MKRTNRHSSAGMIMIDVLAGLMLLAALSSVMMVALNYRQRAAIKFGDERQAIELARQTLSNLQAHQPAPAPTDATIKVTPTTQPSGDMHWVRVDVELNGRRASLMGIAPTTQPGGRP